MMDKDDLPEALMRRESQPKAVKNSCEGSSPAWAETASRELGVLGGLR